MRRRVGEDVRGRGARTVVVEGEGAALWAGEREMELAAAEKDGGKGRMGRMGKTRKMGRAGQTHGLGLMTFWPRPAPPKEDMTVVVWAASEWREA
jgi:hypothetical protein